MEQTKTIGQRLANVLEHIKRVPKNGRNNFHKYDYTTESDLTDFVRPLLAKEGLTIIPSIDEYSRTGDKKDGFKITIKMSFTIMADNGETLGPFSWYGDADDKNDKALYKAVTGGVKYFLFKLFLVSTGDDPEHDGQTPPRRPTPRKPQVKPAKVTPKTPPTCGTDDILMASAKAMYADYEALGMHTTHIKNAIKKCTGKTTMRALTEDDLTKISNDITTRQKEANNG